MHQQMNNKMNEPTKTKYRNSTKIKGYHHFHLPGRSRGTPCTHPRHPKKTFCVFSPSWSLPEEPPGRPGDPPRDVQRRPTDAQGNPRRPKGFLRGPQRARVPPGTGRDAQKHPSDPQPPFRDPRDTPKTVPGCPGFPVPPPWVLKCLP